MSRLAELIAQREGFGISGALPTRNDNPGDLMHAPGEMHPADAPNSIGSFTDAAAGWAALETQLQRYAARGLTLAEMICGTPDSNGQLQGGYAPAPQNDAVGYVHFLCDGLPATSDMLVVDALKIPGRTPNV